MEFPSPTPRRIARPRWLDVRLAFGVAFVLGAVLLGAVVVGRARHTEPQVAVTHDLAAGTTLQAGDVHVVDAQLPSSARYLSDPDAVVGKVLNRPLAAGELVPAGALGTATAATTVTVPLAADAAPDLRRGQRIVVWLSTAACPDTLLLPDVTVQDVHADDSGFGSSTGGQDAVVTVAPALAQRVVQALAIDKATIRAGVLSGTAGGAAPDLPDLSGCGTSTAP